MAPERFINFQADIEDITAHRLVKLCTDAYRDALSKITILINSRGGGVPQGLALYNFIRGLPIEVEVHNIGMVDSIANAVYLAADKRYSVPSARFLLHGVTISGQALTEENLVRGLKTVRRDNELVATTIAGRTKYTVEELKELFKGEHVLSAEEAKEKGIVHEIKELQLPTDAEVFDILDLH